MILFIIFITFEGKYLGLVPIKKDIYHHHTDCVKLKKAFYNLKAYKFQIIDYVIF